MTHIEIAILMMVKYAGAVSGPWQTVGAEVVEKLLKEKMIKQYGYLYELTDKGNKIVQDLIITYLAHDLDDKIDQPIKL